MVLSKLAVSNNKYVSFSSLSTIYVNAVVTLMITYPTLKTVTYTFALPHTNLFLSFSDSLSNKG
jgi:hypothetical protein